MHWPFSCPDVLLTRTTRRGSPILKPRQWRGLMQPSSGYSKVAAKRQRAAPPFSSKYLMGHPLRTFWQKKNWPRHVSFELWATKGSKVRSFLREIAGYCAFKGHIEHDEVSFDHFRSELTSLTPSQCPLIFWSRSTSRSRSDQRTRWHLWQLHA